MRNIALQSSHGLRLALAVLLLLVAAPWQMSAQVLYGSVVGTVEDPSGAVVPMAKITLTNTATGVSRDVQDDDQGRYNALSLAAGTYKMVVTAAGFRTLTRTGIEVTINTVTRVEARLEVGQLTDQVTVSASASALQSPLFLSG